MSDKYSDYIHHVEDDIKSYLVRNISFKSIFASYLIRVIPCRNVNAKFVKLFFESLTYWKQLFEVAWGAGQPNVHGTRLKKLLIPFPPLKGQKAIVKKVESLMQAVIKEAFEPNKDQEINQCLK